MKKYILLSILAISTTLHIHAQRSQLIAVLNHDGTNTTYYGSSALQEANEAAADGDIITLSGGIFLPVNLSKAITIRGAGMSHNDSTNIHRTQISVTIADSTSNLSIENLWIEDLTNTGKALAHVRFFKVGTYGLNVYEGSNVILINCIIQNTLFCADNATVSVFNSVIYFPHADTVNSSAYYCNCLISFPYDGSHSRTHNTRECNQSYTVFENCVIYDYREGFWEFAFEETITAHHNVGRGADLFSRVFDNTNTTLSYDDFLSIFGGNAWYEGYNDANTYRLTDAAAATYLGSDGTQVGIYGGLFPFDSKAHHPVITKADIARHDDNGKLKVMIEVSSYE